MTEAEWLECEHPHTMLTYLHRRVSKRKLRLYACASCRHWWSRLVDERSRNVVDVAERYADGLVRYPELKAAREAAQEASNELKRVYQRAAPGPSWTRALFAAGTAAEAVDVARREAWLAAWYLADEVEGDHPAWLRDIFGPLPFRQVSVEPSLLTWQGCTVVKLAHGIYRECAFDRMPVLADALEEAGCENQEVLLHCRSQGDHVRGCWVVDLLLGKK